MLHERLRVALLLTLCVGLAFYYQLTIALYLILMLGTTYDLWTCWWMVRTLSKRNLVSMFGLLVYITNTFIYIYYKNRLPLITTIVIVTQMSDISQYLIGSYLGSHRIGWVSPNKTYEGYIGSLVTTFIISLFQNEPLYLLLLMHFGGILGGLFSSLIKRHMGLKDFSLLLGPHGGWLDRVDSTLGASILISMYM